MDAIYPRFARADAVFYEDPARVRATRVGTIRSPRRPRLGAWTFRDDGNGAGGRRRTRCSRAGLEDPCQRTTRGRRRDPRRVARFCHAERLVLNICRTKGPVRGDREGCRTVVVGQVRHALPARPDVAPVTRSTRSRPRSADCPDPTSSPTSAGARGPSRALRRVRPPDHEARRHTRCSPFATPTATSWRMCEGPGFAPPPGSCCPISSRSSGRHSAGRSRPRASP